MAHGFVHPTRCALIAGVSAFAVGTPLAANAQPASTQANVQLEEVVVTVRKAAERMQDVPAAITAITAQQLRDRPIVTPMDLRLATPGLYAAPSARNANVVRFIIRGQSQADSLLATDSSTGVYFDDVNQPRDYGTRVAMFDVDHVEVAKGPQGTLFGRNTTGGSVGVFTRQPNLDAVGGFVTLSAGRFDSYGATGAVNVPLVDGVLAARLSGIYSMTGGYAFGFGGYPLRKVKDLGLRAQVLYRPTDELSVRAAGSYTRSRGASNIFILREVVPGIQSGDIDLGRQLGFPTATAGAAGNAYYQNAMATQGRYRNSSLPASPDVYEGWQGSLQATWDFSEALRIKSTTAYSRFQRSSNNDVDVVPFPVGFAYTATSEKFFSQEFQFNGQISKVKYVAGVFYSNESGNEYAPNSFLPVLSGTTTLYDDDLRNKALGIYAQADYSPIEALTFTAGVRWSRDERGLVSRNRLITNATGAVTCTTPAALRSPAGTCRIHPDDLTSEKTNYTLAVKYAVTPDLNVYATTRSGFRAGGWNIFTDLRNGLSPFGPEQVKDYEVGFKSEWLDKRLRLNAALFHSDYQDIQRSSLTFLSTGGSVRVIRNAAEATIKGFEVDALAVPIAGLRLDAMLSYVDAGYDEFVVRNPAGVIVEDRTNEPFEAPKWTYSLGATYEWQLQDGNLRARVDYYHQSKNYLTSPVMRGDAALMQKGYGLLGARLEWNNEPTGLQVALVGRNLTNEYYFSSGTDLRSIGWVVGIPGEPRFFGVQVTKRWGGG